jgi:hypothetical protein
MIAFLDEAVRLFRRAGGFSSRKQVVTVEKIGGRSGSTESAPRLVGDSSEIAVRPPA